MSYLQTIATIVGVVSGLSGLWLGILNYRHQRDTSRPHIVVRASFVPGPAEPGAKDIVEACGIMQISNVGQVPTTGLTIGFLPARWTDQGIFAIETVSLNGEKWTDELKPQHAAWLRFKLEDLGDPDGLGPAFAMTITGDVFKASRQDTEWFTHRLKAARLSPPLPAAPCTEPQAAPSPSALTHRSA